MKKKPATRRSESLKLHRETLLGLELGEIRKVAAGYPRTDFCTQYRHGISTC
jgi:hypothetical protein